ncbi:nucleotidyltransferase family protein [Murdochiella vaginalis]|uniref:nucleotidyltransferase family protein n=1 Tax=Murdochiella vaginalis TaxID=1852373 RepID=UPI0008FDC7A6|nr:sugar phosphate nucleotidyltransferase [Murdochiella vaginalis]
MNNKPILLVLAAGMGSRYGGLKQIDPLGPTGEIIIDYSIFDAVEAGFERFIFVIKEENREAFDEVLTNHLPKDLEINIVYQDLEDVPDGFTIPEGREKPWGTTHAICAAKDVIDAPFAVINADDYYGKEAYKKIYAFLTSDKIKENHHAMVGFKIKNTLTEHGSVSRGVCEVENGRLVQIVERTKLFKEGDGARFVDENGNEQHLAGENVVSMNFWGFHPAFLPFLQKDLERFFREDVPKNPLKSEALLPTAVGTGLSEGKLSVEVLTTNDTWMGVTYHEDKEPVMAGFKALVDRGVYPSPLWK